MTEQEWKLKVEGEAYVIASDCEVVALFREREFCVFVSGGCELTQREVLHTGFRRMCNF